MPPKRRAATRTCAAKFSVYSESGDVVKCGATSEGSSKWCSNHTIQRQKLYNVFQASSSALDSFLKNRVCQSVVQVQSCSSSDQLREWHRALSEKCALINRCIEAHSYISEHFPGNDLDFGHKAYLDNLRRHLDQLHELRHAVEVAGRKSILKALRALWLLQEDYDFRHINTCGVCTDHGRTRKLKPWVRILNTENPTSVHESDPTELESKEKKSRAHLDLWTRLSFHCTPPESRFWDERLVVLITYLIRMACGDPELFLFTQNFSEMEEVLSDRNLDDSISEKLQSYLDDPNPKQLRNAIEDVLRQKEGSDEEHVVILGRRLYKGLRKGAYPLHALGHWLAFFPSECVCSVSSIYTSFLARSSAHKLATLYRPSPSSSDEITIASTINSLCGLIPGHVPNPIDHVEIHPPRSYLKEGKRWYKQYSYIPVLAGCIALDEPKASEFIDACQRTGTGLNIFLRKGLKGQVLTSPATTNTNGKIIERYVREAPSMTELATFPWMPDRHVNTMSSSELSEIAQHISPDGKFSNDAWYFVIYGDEKTLSTGSDILNKVGRIWLEEVYHFKTVFELRESLVEELVGSGELERSVDLEERSAEGPGLMLNVTDVQQEALPRLVFPHLARYGLLDMESFYEIVLGGSVPDENVL